MQSILKLLAALLDWIRNLFGKGPSMGMADQVKDAIRKGIIVPLQLPVSALAVLVAQSDLETGRWGSLVFVNTLSLFNRHVGSGRGEWRSDQKPYYASAADPDLRTYTDIYQSARDMAQLLTDPLYKQALFLLRNGDNEGYAYALEDAGFTVSSGYAQNILDRQTAYV